MSDTDYTTVDVAIRHVPDTLSPAEESAPNPREQGAGFYEIGVVFDGAFVPFAVKKAGGVQKKLDAAKAAAASSAPSTEPDTTGGGGGSPEQTV